MPYDLDPELEYFIGISLPPLETKFFTELRRKLEQRDHLSGPPHITLKPPFVYHFEKPLVEQLAKWSRKQRPFTITLEKVGSFKQKNYSTLFLSPEKGRPFKYLEQSLSKSIRFLPAETNYVPHLTLANRVPHDQLPALKQVVRNMKMKLELEVNQITLYCHHRMKPWSIHSTYHFLSQD